MPRFIATVELSYDGEITPDAIHDLLDGTLEHCRQESMLLSDPQDDDQSCNWISVIEVVEAQEA